MEVEWLSSTHQYRIGPYIIDAEVLTRLPHHELEQIRSLRTVSELNFWIQTTGLRVSAELLDEPSNHRGAIRYLATIARERSGR